MPDRAPPTERWRVLGRLLPREVRERIFEPAFSDLRVAWLRSGGASRHLPFGLHVVGTYVGCFGIAIPRMFVHEGRLTHVGRYSLWAAGLLAAVVLVAANVAQSYGSYSP